MNEEIRKNASDKSILLQKVFEYVSRYFVIIAGSLSGTTGLFTAVGFIAERSHLSMLGFSLIPVDMELYLYTGAKFFALLPVLVITAVGFNIIKIYQWVLILAGILVIWGILRRFKVAAPVRNALKSLREWIREFAFNHLSGFLFLVMVVQFVALFQMFIAFQMTDLIFDTLSHTVVHDMGIFSSAEELKFWIFKNNTTALIDYMGKLFIILNILGLLLWYLISLLRQKMTIVLNLWQNMWLGLSVLVFLTQLILLPANYGVLLLSNEFPVVEVHFSEDFEKIFREGEPVQLKNDLSKNKRMILLYQDGSDFYLYSRSGEQPKVWYVDSGNIRSLVYTGRANIFESLAEPAGSE